MGALSGKAGKVTWSSQTVTKIRRWNLAYEADGLDYTSFDSGGDREFLGGLIRWGGTCEVVLDDGAGDPPQAPGAAAAQIHLEGLDATPAVSYYGQAFCRRLAPVCDVEGLVTAEYEFQGTGVLSIGEPP